MRRETYLIGNSIAAAALNADAAYSALDDQKELINDPAFYVELGEVLEQHQTSVWALENLRDLVNRLINQRESARGL